jgi:hypothetical protein
VSWWDPNDRWVIVMIILAAIVAAGAVVYLWY